MKIFIGAIPIVNWVAALLYIIIFILEMEHDEVEPKY
jgi:hypothetical protein